MRFVLWITVNALALAAATGLLRGIRLTSETTEDKVLTLLLVALVFGVVNAVVRPVVKLLSLPFILLTLGLFVFVINALMLLLTGWLAGNLGLDFEVDGFWTAVAGGIIIMAATWALEILLREKD